MKPSGIGGQAVMEGIMMRNGSKYAVAVRRADQSIEVKVNEYHGIAEICPFFKVPFVRGIVNFIESFYLGMKTLWYSASFYEEEEAKRREEWEEWISTGTGRNFTGDLKNKHSIGSFSKIKLILDKIMMFFLTLCSVVIAITLFMLFPMFLSERILGLEASIEKTALEGVLRLFLFFFYLLVISGIEDVKRVFMYHGAEHKVINCVENGLELTVENAKKQSRQHKRCGTSFLFLVVFLSILFFLFIRTEVLWQKIVFRFLFIPIIAAVSYEFIRLAGRSEHIIIEYLSKPGLWLQKLTTREPEDEMILVAIQSVEAVFNWREFLQINGMKLSQTPYSMEDNSKKEKQQENNQVQEKELKKEQEIASTIEENQEMQEEEKEDIKTLSMVTKERLQQTLINDEYRDRDDFGPQEKEDDPILKALDKFFGE